jgi:hypothetical protein
MASFVGSRIFIPSELMEFFRHASMSFIFLGRSTAGTLFDIDPKCLMCITIFRLPSLERNVLPV